MGNILNFVFIFVGIIGAIATLSDAKKSKAKRQLKQFAQKPKLSTAVDIYKTVSTDWQDDEQSDINTTLDTDDIIDTYEDEEAYETELLTPMSEEIDAGQVYSDEEWQMISEKKTSQVPVSHMKQKLAKVSLKQAFIYAQILDKPKALQNESYDMEVR